MRNRYLFAIKLFFVVAILFMLLSSSAMAAFSQVDWQYFKGITLPSGLKQGDLVELVPDTEVFAGAVTGLDDLRIIGGADREVPYKLEIGRAEQQRTSFIVSIRDAGYVPGSYNIFTADLGQQGILHNEIEIKTTSTNFRRTASVETSADGVTWMKVAEQTIYDFTVKERNFTTRNTRLRYPDSTARYLRVKIIDDGEGSLGITGATVFFVKETPAREVQWTVSILNISRDTEQRATLVELDLGTPKLPSYRLDIRAPETNFYRDVTVEASTDLKKWSTVLPRASIYAFDTPKFVGKSLSITYPESYSRYLRLVIHDEDSPPLTVQGINVWGSLRRLVFIAEPQESYKLYYGNNEARRPSYDIERIFPYLVTAQLPRVTLGDQAINPSFVEKKPPISERFPWLFPTVIAVAVIIVGLILFGILRQARKVLPPPRQ